MDRGLGFRAAARLALLGLSLVAVAGSAEARGNVAGSVVSVGGGPGFGGNVAGSVVSVGGRPGFAGFHGYRSRVVGFRGGNRFAVTRVGFGGARYGLGVSGPVGLGAAGSSFGLGYVGVGRANPYAGYYGYAYTGYPYGD